MRTPLHYYYKPYTFLKPQIHKTVSISQLLTLANALVKSSQISITQLLADRLAEMKLRAQRQLLLPYHCQYQLNRSSLWQLLYRKQLVKQIISHLRESDSMFTHECII